MAAQASRMAVGRGGGLCCTFRPLRPFSDHFKSKNLLLNVFVLFFSVFRFLASSFLLF